MGKSYVEQRDGGYWAADTRVSLDSLVYAFRAGQTAESLAQSFPVLTLEQAYGALTYYLANRKSSMPTCVRRRRTLPNSRRTSASRSVLSSRCLEQLWCQV